MIMVIIVEKKRYSSTMECTELTVKRVNVDSMVYLLKALAVMAD